MNSEIIQILACNNSDALKYFNLIFIFFNAFQYSNNSIDDETSFRVKKFLYLPHEWNNVFYPGFPFF
jgi:hypothetical protein